MISATHTSPRPTGRRLSDAARAARDRLRRRIRKGGPPGVPSTDDAVVRALCHDMHGSLACLETALHLLAHDEARHGELLEMARSQAAHLSSLLRTAEASGSTPVRPPTTARPLRDVVAASLAASGLPRPQLTVRICEGAGDVPVGDAHLQRILINLLENAHRHGRGEPVLLDVTNRPGRVRILVRQAGVPSRRVVGHLSREDPPAELTGLGLWSVRRQTHELGGRILWDDGGGALTLLIELPDR